MKKIIAISLLLVFALGMLVSCDLLGFNKTPDDTDSTQNNNDTTTTVITYKGSALVDAIVDNAYTGSVATAKGPKGITYKVKEGSELPDGMVLSKAGRLSGIPTTTGEYEFIVVASAKGADSVEATFTIKVSKFKLAFKSKDIANAIVGEEYTDSIATATGSDEITYALKEGSSLPDGLTLAEDGTISGIATSRVIGHSFTVVAKAEGFDTSEAEFVISATYTIYTYQAEWALAEKNESGAKHSPNKNGSLGSGYVDFAGDKCEYSAIEFKITSSKAGLANLTFSLGLRDKVNKLSEVYTIILNGETLNPSDIIVPATENSTLSWFDWQKINVGNISLIEGENSIVIFARNYRLLDYIEIEPLENQMLYWEDCTDTYPSNADPFKLPLNNPSSLGTIFGEGYTVTGVYDVNQFSNNVIGTERSNILDTIGNLTIGSNHTFKVTATNGTESRSILLPVVTELAVLSTVKIEAEDGELHSAEVNGQIKTPIVGTGNDAEGGFVDFIARGTSVTFTFNCNSEVSATMVLRFGRNNNKRMLSDTYKILVNGVEITYNAEIDSNAPGTKNWYDWYSLSIPERFLLVEGENTIEIIGTSSPLILDNITLQFYEENVEITK